MRWPVHYALLRRALYGDAPRPRPVARVVIQPSEAYITAQKQRGDRLFAAAIIMVVLVDLLVLAQLGVFG